MIYVSKIEKENIILGIEAAARAVGFALMEVEAAGIRVRMRHR